MSPSPTDKSLKKIKSGVLSRGFALAKVSMSAGARVAGHAVGTIFSNEIEKAERTKELLMSQVQALSKELGQLKGSLMKVGQMLSMYGEQFLPPEANALLKSLQNQSPPLAWPEIEKALKQHLTEAQLQTVEIDPYPIASASLGQVHRALRKADGRWLAMKIQYPGVDRAIEGDLKTLRSVLSLTKLIPKGPSYDELFEEVRTMLHQEVDYARELELTREFHKLLENESRFIVPQTVPELSTSRILTTTYEEGVAVDGPEVLSLSQERRNAIGAALLDLYFRELFVLGAVQTDPHFGNYRLRLGKEGQVDQLVLLDFGAVRKLDESFRNAYLELIRGTCQLNAEQVIRQAIRLNLLKEDDSPELKMHLAQLCFLVTEPFHSIESLKTIEGARTDLCDPDGCYRWGESDLSKRAARKATELVMAFKLRPPPRELVFLDRKMGGIFIFLAVLKVRIRARDILMPYI
jgi:predicted unusual protein kinase regulating ubiquinone biosynthesis (AarF/ABC1/UbiB family)